MFHFCTVPSPHNAGRRPPSQRAAQPGYLSEDCLGQVQPPRLHVVRIAYVICMIVSEICPFQSIEDLSRK